MKQNLKDTLTVIAIIVVSAVFFLYMYGVLDYFNIGADGS